MKYSWKFKAPTLLLVIGATIISFSSVWVKFSDVSPSASAFYRVFFGSIFLLLLTLRSGDYTSVRKSHLFFGCLCGFFFALDLVCWHGSILRVGPGLATLLGNFQVFILAGAGIFFLKERYNRTLFLSLPLAMTGLLLIVGLNWRGLDSNYRDGLYLGLATAVFYSAYILTLKSFSTSSTARYLPMTLLSIFASLFLAAYIFFTQDSFAITDLKTLISLICLGFFSQCLGWVIIAASLPRISASSAGLILLLQPALSFVWDVVIFSRPTSIINWLGVILALFSIYLGISARQKK